MSDRATRQMAEFTKVLKMQFRMFRSIDIRLEAILNALRREEKNPSRVPQEVDIPIVDREGDGEGVG